MFIKKAKKKVLLIAEACDNHFGDIDLAKKFVILAKKSGADAIKFQHHIPDEEMLPMVPKSSNFKISLYKFLKKYALKISHHELLMNFCRKQKIKYLCTPFSLKAAMELNEMGLDTFKIGSGEFTDLPFIKKILNFNKPIILSTGMSKIGDIKFMNKFINKWRRNNSIAVMNCTSEYPPNFEDLNLGFIPKLKKICNKFTVGHSDHTNNIFTSLSAVTLGARIIEKHVFINYKSIGPDREVSISFDQLKELAQGIRIIEKCLDDKKRIYQKERQIEKWAKRSIVSTQDLFPGNKLSEKNIWSKRPGTGISSRLYFKYLGKIVKKKIDKNKLIKNSDLI
jgi:N-acetylneuraminate synthase